MRWLVRILFALGLLCGVGASASAPDPLDGLRITHWSLEEGAPSRINSIAQSVDGMLWIGGVDGLHRFDGVTFERIDTAQHLVVSQIMASRGGDVWIGLGRSRGLLVWRGGVLRPSGMPGVSREVNDIVEGPDGAIWVARGGRSVRSLARLAHGHWEEFDRTSGLPEQPVWNILFARDGTLWVVLDHAIYRRRPGATQFEPTGLEVPARASLAKDASGGIWLSDRTGTRRVAQSGAGPIHVDHRLDHPDPAGGTRTLFDRHGDLWEATWSNGIARIVAPLGPPGSSGVLSIGTDMGLLSSQTRAVFEDREGNIWIGTEMGLNMLRRVPVTIAPVIPRNAPSTYRLAVDKLGVVYVGEASGVFRIAPGAQPERVLATARPVEALCAAQSGGVWVITPDSVQRLGPSPSPPRTKPPALSQACVEDAAGRLWLPSLDHGLFLLEKGRWQTWPRLDASHGIPANAVLLPDGRAAIYFRAARPRRAMPFLALDDSMVASGGVEGLLLGQGTMLASGAFGLGAPLLPGRPVLTKDRYPWAASLNGFAQGSNGESWAIGDQGLVRMRTAELTRAFSRPGSPVTVRVFDYRDGANSFVPKAGGSQLVVGGDGRAWFATRRNVLSINPATLATNPMPPNVLIRDVTANRLRRPANEGMTLPPKTTRVEIGFTATSLSVPQRVQFRYRLLGSDETWTTVQNQRLAVFSDLGPGRYTFEVSAANEDGVWSRVPARLNFTIERAFYQTLWFRALVVLAVCAILYTLFNLRLIQVSGQIHDRMLARNRERERIARELHDTMIQGVQGLILRFQAVADRFAGDPEAQAVLLPALDRAEEMLVEGRDRVTGLRRMDDRNVVEELARLAEQDIYPAGLISPLQVTGKPRRLLPEMLDELVAVVCEALNNAACHSGASRIDIGVHFGRLHFTAFVRDNGKGIPRDFATARGRPGHFGLLGMYERARTMKGKLRIESAEGFGTEIRLIVPARFAYLPGQGA